MQEFPVWHRAISMYVTCTQLLSFTWVVRLLRQCSITVKIERPDNKLCCCPENLFLNILLSVSNENRIISKIKRIMLVRYWVVWTTFCMFIIFLVYWTRYAYLPFAWYYSGSKRLNEVHSQRLYHMSSNIFS